MPLVDQLDEEFRQRGFAVEVVLIYKNPRGGRYYRIPDFAPCLVECIINRHSLRIYFRNALIDIKPTLVSEVRQLDKGEVKNLKNGPSYRYLVECDQDLQTLMSFIDRHVLPIEP
jgi:hypothetical protein